MFWEDLSTFYQMFRGLKSEPLL